MAPDPTPAYEAWVIGEHILPDDAPPDLLPAAHGWVLLYSYDTEEWDVLDPDDFDAEYQFT